MAIMKVMLQNLVGERNEKHVQIDCQDEKIAKLMKKLKMELAESFYKGSRRKKDYNVFNQSETFEDDNVSKNDDKLCSGTSNKGGKSHSVAPNKGDKPYNSI